MMKPILGPGAKCLGYFLEDASSIKLLTAGGVVLGIYHKNTDITTTTGNFFVGYGNQLYSLLEDSK